MMYAFQSKVGEPMIYWCVIFWGCMAGVLPGGEARASSEFSRAMRFLDEQQYVEAQESLIDAVEKVLQSPDVKENVDNGEQEAFNTFFIEYGESAQSREKTKALLENVQKSLVDHPHYYSLMYYVAACQANLGNLRQFFDTFFVAVSNRPACFMASKMIGVVHLRLYESSSDEAIRLGHRKKAVSALKAAFKKEPGDISLLMKLAFILPESEQRDLVREVCLGVLGQSKAMRRKDCLYIIELAMSLSMYEEAKLLVDKARVWYDYSRVLNEISKELEKR